jgi:4,5-DOPA dioxygenase extradiol
MQHAPTPVLFLSHGPPTFALADNPTTRHWAALPERLPAPPKAVLCISAHWDTPMPRIAGGAAHPPIQHDFYGFPPELYHVTWSPKGSGDWAERIADVCGEEPDGLLADPDRPLDHGVWVPLRAAWPKPPMPVLQISLSTRKGGPWHLDLGRRLAPLREEGVLIVASGGIVHNLSRLSPGAPDDTAAPWARQFTDAFEAALAKSDEALLTDPWRLPHGQQAHPTLEHYYPLLVALGAAGEEPLVPIHRAWTLATLALHSYATPTLKAEALPKEEVGEEEREAA